MPEPEKRRQRSWLKWVGLQEPPIDPDAWMAVEQDLGVDDTETGFSAAASQIADALKAAGIEVHQRAYARPDQGRTSAFTLQALVGGLPAVNRVRIAVVVHNRDLQQAKQILAGLPPSKDVNLQATFTERGSSDN